YGSIPGKGEGIGDLHGFAAFRIDCPGGWAVGQRLPDRGIKSNNDFQPTLGSKWMGAKLALPEIIGTGILRRAQKNRWTQSGVMPATSPGAISAEIHRHPSGSAIAGFPV